MSLGPRRYHSYSYVLVSTHASSIIFMKKSWSRAIKHLTNLCHSTIAVASLGSVFVTVWLRSKLDPRDHDTLSESNVASTCGPMPILDRVCWQAIFQTFFRLYALKIADFAPSAVPTTGVQLPNATFSVVVVPLIAPPTASHPASFISLFLSSLHFLLFSVQFTGIYSSYFRINNLRWQ